jgi:hypothetical protein
VSSSRLGIAQNVHTPATVRVSVQANRRAADAFQVREPYHSPPVALPRA